MTPHRGKGQGKLPKPAASCDPSLTYRRIVAKAGTNLLTGGSGALDQATMGRLVAQIASLRKAGAEVALVTSGAVAAGREVLARAGVAPPPRSREVPFRQVLAAVGQGHLLKTYEDLFARHGVPVAQALLTRRDIADRLGYLNIRNSMLQLMALGVAPIINENDVVAVEELAGESFGDNDTLSAMVANIVDADLLVILSDVGGLYTADPNTHKDATLIPQVERIDAAIEALAGPPLSERSRGGMRTKVEAAKLATASGTDVVVCDGKEPEVIIRLAKGGQAGTLFRAQTSRRESRERWMLGTAVATGAIVVDSGARAALLEQHKSLLPAGVVDARGTFDRGDVVPIVTTTGERIAVGIANYAAHEVRRLAGKRSSEVQQALGYTYGDEVVHRNNMVAG